MARYIFITGGVVSSLGKGLASAALGALLQARGYSVRLRKLDPYLNVDPGTMSPYQHGEVFVTDDGAETDLDLGHYERFTGRSANRQDNITTGRLYMDIIAKRAARRLSRRHGAGHSPRHRRDQGIRRYPAMRGSISFSSKSAARSATSRACRFSRRSASSARSCRSAARIYIHLTLLPFIPSAGELKTKPTQHSVKELRSIGIQPDILLCRADREIPMNERRKIALFCNVRPSAVVQALDVSSIYDVPIAYHREGLDEAVLAAFRMDGPPPPDLSRWQAISERISTPDGEVTIAVVGKYTGLPDAYKSLNEALVHGGIANRVKVNLEWIESEVFERADPAPYLQGVHGILVPGGFGERGSEGKIRAATFARTRQVPFFGICFGMQMACIEAARNLVGLEGASSTEFGPAREPVIGLMTEWMRGNELEQRRSGGNLGGTMRLGAYEAVLEPGSRVADIYGSLRISERHRHRYEVNTRYRERLEGKGITFSGMSPDGLLPEIIEIGEHPWYIGVQFHPELKSRPFEPHPLFRSFVGAAIDQSRLV